MISKLCNKTSFIVGNKKNSGKTTFLNSALDSLRKKTPLAYLSIGVDGETRDQIFGFNKPRVFAKKGDYIVTLESALAYTKAKFKKLKTFSYKTVLGKPVLIKIVSDGFIEIIGPENNSQLSEILKYLSKKLKVKTILIDGAINRITQVSSFDNSSFVLILRVDRYREKASAEELKRILALSSIRRCECKKYKAIKGALTKNKAEQISISEKNIVVSDFTKVFLDYRELKKFLKNHRLYFLNSFNLLFVVVNLFGSSKKEFLNELSDVKRDKIAFVNEIEG